MKAAYPEPRIREDLISRADEVRLRATSMLSASHRSAYGQYLTPGHVARLMASMLECRLDNPVILDAGAGTGSLIVALVDAFCHRKERPHSIHAVCYEIEPIFLAPLTDNLELCKKVCGEAGITFSFEVRSESFLESASRLLECSVLGGQASEQFDIAILNPPYKRISSSSRERLLLRAIGLETVNLYTGFIGAACRLLRDGGELVAISPRSFCNGPYYKPFRRYLLDMMSIERVHLFESRNTAFRDDEILQETVITHARKSQRLGAVRLSSSLGMPGSGETSRLLPYDQVVLPHDPECFLRILLDQDQQASTDRLTKFKCSLRDLKIEVSTGRVVDFRVKPFLRMEPEDECVPLIYPMHFDGWGIRWPIEGAKKPNALALNKSTAGMLLPAGGFVLTKRFSAKEERRRLVAVVYEEQHTSSSEVAFENHLNVFHVQGAGLPRLLAWGIAAYLNSGMADDYFRTFNGHTQVNATDLRSLPYPAREQLERLGQFACATLPGALEIDRFIERELL